MAHRVFATRQDHRTAIARGVFAERDFLDCTIGKGQREVRLFVNSRGNGANVGVASEDADEMCLLVFSYIGGNPHTNSG